MARCALILADPLLLTLDTQEGVARYVLLLDSPSWSARVSRSREDDVPALPPGARHKLQLSLDKPGEIVFNENRRALPVETEDQVPLAPGHHSYLLTGDGKTVAGSLHMPKEGTVTLTVQRDRGEVDLLIRRGVRSSARPD